MIVMEDGLRVKVLAEAKAALEGIDTSVIAAQVHALIRRHHAPPEPLEHEGDPDESASVFAARRQRGGIRLEFGYSQDQHTSSRYDKSKSATGWLTVSTDGSALLRGSLGRLRDWMDRNPL
ncbi:MAG: hypothetical protein R6X02_34830 [Enhygromyxa sp.]